MSPNQQDGQGVEAPVAQWQAIKSRAQYVARLLCGSGYGEGATYFLELGALSSLPALLPVRLMLQAIARQLMAYNLFLRGPDS